MLLSLAGLGAIGGDILAQTDAVPTHRAPSNQLSVKLLESLQSPEQTYGWKTSEENGKLEFVVQLSPKSFTVEKGGDTTKSDTHFVRQAFLLDVPKSLLGRFEVVVVRIGEATLPRDRLAEHSNLTSNQSAASETPNEDPTRKIGADNSSGELGWLPDESGRNLQGIVQLSHTMCSYMLSSQKELASNPPSAVASKITQIAIVIGAGPFPVNPVAIAPTDASESQPRSSTQAATDGADTVEALKRRYNEREQHARQLAAKLQLATTVIPSQKQELEKAVRESFEAAQALQRAELARRLQSMQQAIDARERRADEIVGRRVEELLNPVLQWEQTSEFR